MSDNRPPRGVDDEGSVVSETPRRQMTATQKVGLAGLLAVVFVGFIWIAQLTKKTQEAKQPDVSLVGGGAFQPAPEAPLSPPPRTTLPMPAASPSAALFAPPQQHEMTPAESPIFAFLGGGDGPRRPAGRCRQCAE